MSLVQAPRLPRAAVHPPFVASPALPAAALAILLAVLTALTLQGLRPAGGPVTKAPALFTALAPPALYSPLPAPEMFTVLR